MQNLGGVAVQGIAAAGDQLGDGDPPYRAGKGKAHSRRPTCDALQRPPLPRQPVVAVFDGLITASLEVVCLQASAGRAEKAKQWRWSAGELQWRRQAAAPAACCTSRAPRDPCGLPRLCVTTSPLSAAAERTAGRGPAREPPAGRQSAGGRRPRATAARGLQLAWFPTRLMVPPRHGGPSCLAISAQLAAAVQWQCRLPCPRIPSCTASLPVIIKALQQRNREALVAGQHFARGPLPIAAAVSQQ